MTILASVFVAILISSTFTQSSEDYEGNITFYGYNSNNPFQPFISNLDTNIANECDANGKFAIIIHGWKEGIFTPWVDMTISNMLRYRGGCVFFMDYSKYANVSDYFTLVLHFPGISAVLLKKVQQIGHYDQQYCYGFSSGARLCIDVGLKLGNQLIGRMDLCEPAGPGFNYFEDPKPAAKIVGCINTSKDKGTKVYNCHQNFRMGYCGLWQDATGSYPIGSHGLCPYFYNLAFTYEFVPNNYYGCSSNRMIKDPPKILRMGYLGDFNRTLYTGDIFIATAKFPPYVLNGNNIDNQFESLMAFNKHASYC